MFSLQAGYKNVVPHSLGTVPYQNRISMVYLAIQRCLHTGLPNRILLHLQRNEPRRPIRAVNRMRRSTVMQRI